jgi:hypothetical protein
MAARLADLLRTKSSGLLTDDLITTTLKVNYALSSQERLEAALERAAALAEALDDSLGVPGVGEIVSELAVSLIACWEAQETVIHETDYKIVADAAKAAQNLNVLRTRGVRALDEIWGEVGKTVLIKTYDDGQDRHVASG